MPRVISSLLVVLTPSIALAAPPPSAEGRWMLDPPQMRKAYEELIDELISTQTLLASSAEMSADQESSEAAAVDEELAAARAALAKLPKREWELLFVKGGAVESMEKVGGAKTEKGGKWKQKKFELSLTLRGARKQRCKMAFDERIHCGERVALVIWKRKPPPKKKRRR